MQEGTFGTELIALENHLNYMYSPGKTLTYEDAVGLASFLNSSLVDRYFRIISGNTQVSATELKKLPLPPWEFIVRIGKQVIQKQAEQSTEVIEHIIMNILGQDLIVGDEEDIQLPVLRDSRIAMGKIQDAQRILQELGLPPAQQNEMSALTLLALSNLSETATWAEISQEVITIHNIMGFMKTNYGRTYAENTREVVRRQVIHQFEQARLIDRNPDDPTRPTNSPNTCYALTDEALHLFKQYNLDSWDDALAQFLAQHGTLWEHYQKSRQAVALPLKLAEGGQLYLTPGKHNALQIAIVEKFGPRYAREFRRHAAEVAWETEVWIAETPEHMIHYNGDKFAGPHEK